MSQPGQTSGSRRAFALLALGALGVVFGDIGTSPLYALKECFSELFGVDPTRANVLGVLSLIFWSLNLVITIKYLALVMRADNNGEGGEAALLALLRPREGQARGMLAVLITAGVFGTALLYGDGLITPVISVLGAVEGLTVIAPPLTPWVPWISLVILLGLFMIQSHGTAKVGALWGPVTAMWFFTIAVWGVLGILREPSVLAAVSPHHAIAFFAENGFSGFLLLGAVVLVVTGGEALYADMGHFGKLPIRVVWLAVVLPALLLNYFGQGALLLSDPTAAGNPFFNLVPTWARVPMLFLATGAAVTASQALITGAFSLTRQVVQLGYLPRLTIVHTSQTQEGQIYMPEVNTALMLGCAGLVITFKTSTAIAGAYGLAVTWTFAVTTVLFCGILYRHWRWPLWRVLLLGVPMLAVDLAFLVANLPKLVHGGWVPLLVAVIMFALMTTWYWGRRIVTHRLREASLPLELFTEGLDANLARVPGTAVFMTSDPSGAPQVMLHHLKHNKVLHERVLVLSFVGEETPHVSEEQRLEVRDVGRGLWQVVAHMGFMESPNVPKVLERLREFGLEVKPASTSFYLGHETILSGGRSGLPRWRKWLFIIMSRNARSAATYFGLPPNRVIELGAQVQL